MEGQEITAPSGLAQIFEPIRAAVFGKQNERLEYVMDSFLKLSPEQRVFAILGGVASLIFVIIGIVWAYLSALGGLQADLDQAFVATNKLRELQAPYSLAQQKIGFLQQKLQINQSLSLISLIEERAKKAGVTVSDFPSQQSLASPGPQLKGLGDAQVARVNFSINKAGLQKIVEFIADIESQPNMIRVTSLKISRGFTDKLYLDASVEVEALIPQTKK